jgi:hypothetical protein
MFDIKAQTQLAGATADMMRAFALAGAHAANLSAYRTMALWTAWSRAWLPPPASRAAVQADLMVARAVDPSFANYRSSGGHAVAQVIMG